MKKVTYKEMSKTAEGRKEVHEIMLEEVKAKINKLVSNAPAANQAKAKALMETAYSKIKQMGNGTIFDYFADDDVDVRNFVRYINDVINGKM